MPSTISWSCESSSDQRRAHRERAADQRADQDARLAGRGADARSQRRVGLDQVLPELHRGEQADATSHVLDEVVIGQLLERVDAASPPSPSICAGRPSCSRMSMFTSAAAATAAWPLYV